MAYNGNSPKLTTWWTFGVVGVLLAMGLLWLALDGGRGHQLGNGEEPALLVPPEAALASEIFMLQSWEVDLLPRLQRATPATESSVTRPQDNLTALALAVAGTLAWAGLTLLLAWKMQPNSRSLARQTPHAMTRVIHRASTV